MSAKIDTIKNSSGQDLLVNGYPRQPGRIIEYLSSVCDGSSVAAGSGTYKFQSVFTQQLLTATTTTVYAVVRGSVIDYIPPVGTTKVTYRFHFTTYWDTDHAINHYKFFIDNNEVVYARHNRSGRYIEDRYTFTWTINIGGANNTNTGRLATWNTPKKLYMMVRNYGSSDDSNLHGTYYWDGAGGTGTANNFSMPQLDIIAAA
jgi:hypothetical protein